MPYYYKLGDIPPKRHTQFRKKNGELFAEEVFSTEGFSNLYAILYHHYPPTRIIQTGDPVNVAPVAAKDNDLKPRALEGFNIEPTDDFLESRKPVLFNDDLIISLAAPRQSLTDYFYKNGDSDEVLFFHEGSGRVKTNYGIVDFEYGDYVVIPRGTIYQIEFTGKNNRLLIAESHSPVVFPKRYLNSHGQLLEHAPFHERDLRVPRALQTIDKKGEFEIKVKKAGMMYPFEYANHPFDVVGWDGYNYPYAFSIHDFEPITGRIHQPPPVHQTFEGRGYVICSFVPRLYDYHPDSIPAPYNHSNIDSDEVLYYVAGDFMSRKHVTKGMITLHPGGIPHGPHPGTVEKSIGKKSTEELAVMIDTFAPLKLTEKGADIQDRSYYKSWVE